METVQLVHYRNLTGDGAWVFNETADIVLADRLDMRHVDSTEDEAVEFTITGEHHTSVIQQARELNFLSEQPDTILPRMDRARGSYIASGLSFQNKVWARDHRGRNRFGDRADGHEP